jgi:hypothetical protein
MDTATLKALEAFPDLLETHFALISEELRHWKPPFWEGIPSEHYTAIEQICHVLDIEVEGYQERLRRTIAEVHPFLPSIDGDVLALERSYSNADPHDVLAAFRKARLETIALISRLSADQFARTAQFEGYGRVTARSLVHFLCSHDQQHLAGLQWLLGQIESRPTEENSTVPQR